jgi:hypothetical protein
VIVTVGELSDAMSVRSRTRATTVPPAGAFARNRMMPSIGRHAETVVWLSAIVSTRLRRTVSVADLEAPFTVAVKMTATSLSTAVVVIGKRPCDCPAATVNEPLAGPATAAFEDVNVPAAPLTAAGRSSDTTPSTASPPTGTVLEKENARGVGGFTITLVGRLTPPDVAFTVTVACVETSAVVIAYVDVSSPDANTIVAGTCKTAVLLEVIATVSPAAGAGHTSVTVPDDVDDGPSREGPVIERGEFGASVSVRDTVDDPVRVSVANVPVATCAVATVNVTVVAPSATVTEEGASSRPGGATDVVNVAPPAGAASVNVNVAVTSMHPVTFVTENASVSANTGGEATSAATRTSLFFIAYLMDSPSPQQTCSWCPSRRL